MIALLCGATSIAASIALLWYLAPRKNQLGPLDRMPVLAPIAPMALMMGLVLGITLFISGLFSII
jgi:hypothetical protein